MSGMKIAHKYISMKFFDWLKSITTHSTKDLRNKSLNKSGEKTLTDVNRTEENVQKQESSTELYLKRRRFKRFPVEGMKVHAKVIVAEIIELSNISIKGACITTTKPMRPGDNVLVKIEYEKVHLSLSGIVIWEKEIEGMDNIEEPVAIYKAGVQFKGISTDTLIQLKDFMRVSGIPDKKMLSREYQPSPLRFNICTNEKAVISCPMTYSVKKISLGGMLVETNCALEIERRYPMAIYLPNENTPIKFQGRIASRIKIQEEKTKLFDIGIEFLNLEENDKSRLNSFFSCL
jgi:hypothetical protein